ncbi:MAG: C25 family cysteine peptidase, partial [Ginsengibacter sp.]
MKLKKSFVVLFLFISAWGYSQPYNNSWIDYNKTYYKFTVGKDGLYRISQSLLNSVGLGNIPAEQFQLWRNGEEEIIYTSKASGVLSASDYIEFWGKMNDGKKDTKLYRIPDYQLSDHFSLQTDTAAYYLTVNPAGNNLKLIDAPNNVTGTLLTPEPYFMNTRGEYFRTLLNPGYGNPAGVYVYSSSYDIGEGWASDYVYPNRPLAVQLNELNLYAGGPAATVRFGVVGSAYNNRNLKVKMGNTYIFDQAMPYFNFYKKELTSVPLSLFNTSTYVRFSFENTSTVFEDRCVVSHVEINYPSTWNFNNKTDFYFELPASATGNYLVIDNFNSGGSTPVLMDMSDYKRYVGDVTSTPGKVKFVLPSSTVASRKFRLVSGAAPLINNITNLQTRSFVNYANASLQGNYLIISHPSLFNSTSGANNVNLYKDYRSSAAGGSYNAKVIDINELVDQFGFGIKKHPSSIRDFIQYAYKNFSVTPKFIFLIGKGITYDDYVKNPASNYVEKLNLVPTFGSPASDVLLSAPHGSIVPSVPIGRLSAVSGDEVGQYLQKMKEYESVQNSTEQTISNKKWMKNVIQIVGGQKVEESDLFRRYMSTYRGILEDTSFGGHVELFSKTSNSAVQLISSQRISELFKEGIGIISYFGHSSANTLEYNLGDPSAYNNPGKYPFFLVSGCTAGNNYIFDTLRLAKNNLSISENFVLSSQRGSIAMLASTHYGVAPYLDEYNIDFYNQMSHENYGGAVGDFIKTTIKQLEGDNPNISFLSRTDIEEMTLHGDPAIHIYPHAKPDYVLEDN